MKQNIIQFHVRFTTTVFRLDDQNRTVITVKNVGAKVATHIDETILEFIF